MKKLINFKYKADRKYVHGSDIYNIISELLGENEYIIDISFRLFTQKNCVLKKNIEASDKVISIIKTNQSKYVLVQTETNVSESYHFDEDNLVSHSLITDNNISMEIDKKYTLIENVIALTKKLNYFIDPIISGKWVFGQLKLLSHLPAQVGSIKISSTRRITNRFSENEIILDGISYGKIIFIVGTP